MLSIAYKDTKEDLEEFWKEQEMPWLHALDDRLFKLWGFKGVPTTIFVDPKGKVLEIRLGAMKLKELEEFSEKLFPKKKS